MRRPIAATTSTIEEPQVEPVEAAAALVASGSPTGRGGSASRRSAPGARRSGRRSDHDGRSNHAGTRRRLGADPASAAAVAPARAAAAAPADLGRRPAHRSPPGPAPAASSQASQLAARAPSSAASVRRAAGRSWAKTHRNTAVLSSAISRHAELGADRLADPQPVPDARVVRVDRRQDDVHVEERRHRRRRRRRSASATRTRAGSRRARTAGTGSARGRASGRRRRRARGPTRRRGSSAGRAAARRGTGRRRTAAARAAGRRRPPPGTGRSTPSWSRRATGASKIQPPLVAMLWPSTGNSAHRL